MSPTAVKRFTKNSKQKMHLLNRISNVLSVTIKSTENKTQTKAASVTAGILGKSKEKEMGYTSLM